MSFIVHEVFVQAFTVICRHLISHSEVLNEWTKWTTWSNFTPMNVNEWSRSFKRTKNYITKYNQQYDPAEEQFEPRNTRKMCRSSFLYDIQPYYGQWKILNKLKSGVAQSTIAAYSNSRMDIVELVKFKMDSIFDAIWETIHKVRKCDFEKTRPKVIWSENINFWFLIEIYRDHC